MILKVGDEYIEQEISITLEKQNWLLNAIDNIVGDFSYSFDITITNSVLKTFGLTSISDLSKFTGFDADLLTSGGITIRRGRVRIDSNNYKTISCTFYSGNSNWINEISGKITDVDLNEYAFDQDDIDNYIATWSNTEGIICPIIDKGALKTRSYPTIFHDVVPGDLSRNQKSDVKAFIYVKTLIRKIFEEVNIKISGSLLTDSTYDKLAVTANNVDAATVETDKRTTKARNATSQGLTTSFAIIDFDDVTTYGFYDGSIGNYETLTYVADIDMYIVIEGHIVIDASKTIQIEGYRNGTISTGSASSSGSTYDFNTFPNTVTLAQGDFFQLRVRVTSGTANVLPGSWLKIIPYAFKKLFPSTLLGDMDKIDFVKNVFNMFNVIPVYNEYSKGLTLSLFKNVKNNEELDMSDYVDSWEEDYSELIDDYAKSNIFTYAEASSDDVSDYNGKYEIAWGAGSIDVDNVHIQDKTGILDLDFIAPWVYLNTAFQQQLIDAQYVTLTTSGGLSGSVTSVSNGAGIAQFNSSTNLIVGTLIRHSGFAEPSYNGDFQVSVNGSGYYELHGVPYVQNSTGSLNALLYDEEESNDMIICMVHTVNGRAIIAINDTGGSSTNSTYFTYPIGVFHLFNNYNKIDVIKQSLCFDVPLNDSNYQFGILDAYYNDIETILNNPVLITVQMYIPEHVFISIDSRRPIRLRMGNINDVFFIEQITGYESSSLPCEVRLIKL